MRVRELRNDILITEGAIRRNKEALKLIEIDLAVNRDSQKFAEDRGLDAIAESERKDVERNERDLRNKKEFIALLERKLLDQKRELANQSDDAKNRVYAFEKEADTLHQKTGDLIGKADCADLELRDALDDSIEDEFVRTITQPFDLRSFQDDNDEVSGNFDGAVLAGKLDRPVTLNGRVFRVNLSELTSSRISLSIDDRAAFEFALRQALAPPRTQVWVSAQCSGFSLDDATRTDGDGFSVNIGVSHPVTQNLTLGLARRYRNVDSDGIGQRYDGTFLGSAGTAAYALPDGYQLDALVIYERGDNKVAAGGTRTSFDSNTFAIDLQASKNFWFGEVVFSPKAGVRHTWTHRDGFAGAAGAAIPSETLTQALATWGGRSSFFVPMDMGSLIGITPSLDFASFAEFNRNPGSNRVGASGRLSLALAFDNDAQLSMSVGGLFLGDYRSWSLGLNGAIPF